MFQTLAKANYRKTRLAARFKPQGFAAGSFSISLEYGHLEGDPFSLERDPDPTKGNEAFYLHPVIRRYHRDRVVSDYHIQDELESEWYRDEYVAPARAYFEDQFESVRA